MHLTNYTSRVFSKCRATNQWMVAGQTVKLILLYWFIHWRKGRRRRRMIMSCVLLVCL